MRVRAGIGMRVGFTSEVRGEVGRDEAGVGRGLLAKGFGEGGWE